jgi:hypothetical protein
MSKKISDAETRAAAAIAAGAAVAEAAAAETAVAAEIAAALGEPDPGPRAQLAQIVAALGIEAARALLAEARQVEAGAGILTRDGRRRTVGGVFFFLARGRVSPEQHEQIWPGARLPGRLRAIKRPATAQPIDRRQPLSRREAARLLSTETGCQGVVMSAKITLVGQPGKIIDKGEVVVTVMKGGDPPTLPKELPEPPAEPTVYLVFIARKQWQKVAAALEQDESDRLIVEGYPALDKKLGVVGVLAHSVTTIGLQAVKRAKD